MCPSFCGNWIVLLCFHFEEEQEKTKKEKLQKKVWPLWWQQERVTLTPKFPIFFKIMQESVKHCGKMDMLVKSLGGLLILWCRPLHQNPWSPLGSHQQQFLKFCLRHSECLLLFVFLSGFWLAAKSGKDKGLLGSEEAEYRRHISVRRGREHQTGIKQ